jgi:hypothetical protein
MLSVHFLLFKFSASSTALLGLGSPVVIVMKIPAMIITRFVAMPDSQGSSGGGVVAEIVDGGVPWFHSDTKEVGLLDNDFE